MSTATRLPSSSAMAESPNQVDGSNTRANCSVASVSFPFGRTGGRATIRLAHRRSGTTGSQHKPDLDQHGPSPSGRRRLYQALTAEPIDGLVHPGVETPTRSIAELALRLGTTVIEVHAQE